jgi:DNA anti-recombination protein RmuC
MSKNRSAGDIERLMAEADELVQRIDAEVRNGMEEEHRLQFQMHAQNIEKIKSEIQDGIEKKKASKYDHGAEGMHEAIQEISEAMRVLAKYLT